MAKETLEIIGSSKDGGLKDIDRLGYRFLSDAGGNELEYRAPRREAIAMFEFG
jgi:hypothetical protein